MRCVYYSFGWWAGARARQTVWEIAFIANYFYPIRSRWSLAGDCTATRFTRGYVSPPSSSISNRNVKRYFPSCELPLRQYCRPKLSTPSLFPLCPRSRRIYHLVDFERYCFLSYARFVFTLLVLLCFNFFFLFFSLASSRIDDLYSLVAKLLRLSNLEDIL